MAGLALAMAFIMAAPDAAFASFEFAERHQHRLVVGIVERVPGVLLLLLRVAEAAQRRRHEARGALVDGRRLFLW